MTNHKPLFPIVEDSIENWLTLFSGKASIDLRDDALLEELEYRLKTIFTDFGLAKITVEIIIRKWKESLSGDINYDIDRLNLLIRTHSYPP